MKCQIQNESWWAIHGIFGFNVFHLSNLMGIISNLLERLHRHRYENVLFEWDKGARFDYRNSEETVYHIDIIECYCHRRAYFQNGKHLTEYDIYLNSAEWRKFLELMAPEGEIVGS